MKKIKNILLTLSLLTPWVVQAQDVDDVYYTPKAPSKKVAEQNTPVAPRQPDQSVFTPADKQMSNPSNGSNGINNTDDFTRSQPVSYNNEPFEKDDYYDYAYTSRIRRFHRPIQTYSYYDPFYTNSYWYNNDPTFWGTSIYLGYNFWGPSYYNPNAWAWGYGNGTCWNNSYDPWGWNNCWNGPRWGNNPYNYWSWNYGWNNGWNNGWGGYGWNNGWGGYGWNNAYANGYNNGFNNGYWSASNNNPNYFNSYDHTSHPRITYGPRQSTSNGGGREIPSNPRQTFQQNMASDLGLVRGDAPVINEPRPRYNTARPTESEPKTRGGNSNDNMGRPSSPRNTDMPTENAPRPRKGVQDPVYNDGRPSQPRNTSPREEAPSAPRNDRDDYGRPSQPRNTSPREEAPSAPRNDRDDYGRPSQPKIETPRETPRSPRSESNDYSRPSQPRVEQPRQRNNVERSSPSRGSSGMGGSSRGSSGTGSTRRGR